MHASLLTELTVASVCLSVSERERGRKRVRGCLCSHVQKLFSAGWNSGYSVCLFFASDIFIYVPLMGTARRENTKLSAFQQVSVAKFGLLEFK